MVAAQFAWQAAAMAFPTTAVMWTQRRDSPVLDFLRPVSRRDYWLGLRGAIARDLILPLAVVAAGLVMSASWWGQGRPLLWLVSAVGFGGLVATAHAMLLVIATARRPLIATTIAVIVFATVGVGPVMAVGEAFRYVRYGGSLGWWPSVAGAFAVLVAGLAIRAGVLSRLEDREIG
ncbi:MAG: hypothetical protein ACKO40_13910 [Planctomycetaceae bacterium]